MGCCYYFVNFVFINLNKLFMKLKSTWLTTLILVFFVHMTFAQTKSVSGLVSDANGPLPGATILIKGTKTGTQTDFDGRYTIDSKIGQTLVFSFIGMESQEVLVTSNKINVTLKENVEELGTIVVTALGISREKKSLGYATQEVSGDDISDTPVSNFADALSGEVAGLGIQSSGTMGGSTNIIVRGFNSIYNNNQALIVIDGTPVINNTNNSTNQTIGRAGYDYGNAASDINPDDIESLNVLKGAAATALYGSRASNGAIIITTKKGRKAKGIGVSFTSSVTAGTVDMETLPKYQNRYGGGYDGDNTLNNTIDINGDGTVDLSAPFDLDASYGTAFDPNLNVYQWNSIYPELPGYLQATPWVAAKNTPNSLFRTGTTHTNSVSFGKNTDTNSFRLGFTNKIQEGVMPNSEIKRNNLSFSASQNFTDKLKGSVDFSYVNTNGRGRNGTGYSAGNLMQGFRQWWQTNVDISEQKDAFFSTGQNITWNAVSNTNRAPQYTNNPYWTLYKNYQNDSRDRYIGNFTLTQEVTSWFNILGRFSYDTYSELREERRDVGSVGVSDYTSSQRKTSELNYDLMGTLNYDVSENLTLDGLVGFNLRVNKLNSIETSTNGGLITPGLFTLANSKNPLTTDDYTKIDYTKKVDGVFAKVGLGYKGTYYLDATARRDRSSSLPSDNNTYFYPSISTSLIFSNLIKQDWLSFGKFRANYAQVGNDTDQYQIFNTYEITPGFGGASSATNPDFFNNPNLKSEKTEDIELGLEMQLFKKRFGFDFSYYQRKTVDLITPIDVSTATGGTNVWLNGADMENKGIELMVNGTPIKTENFSWDIKLNYAQNRSEVTRLAEDIEFIQLASVQGGITLGAALGEPFGVIRGRDYVYHENGQPIIGTNGYYRRTSSSNNVIGNINPDWTGGVKNNLKYKNLSLSFLIDIKKGGDIFSLDTWYGYYSGLYDFTAGNNHLGNPLRDPVSAGGGVILDGVQADGSQNTVVADASTADTSPWGVANAPQAAHVYDASFVKLREVTFGYNFSDKLTQKLSLQKLTLSIIGRNLWIIHKNTPYSDPESGLSSGNIQGYQSGAYPSVREIGASLKLEF